MTTDEIALVREYAASQSDSAFAEIVSRHLNFVYSSALRQVRNPHMAQEVTQAVFIILARKAGSLNSDTILASWLHRATCYVSANALQAELRRRMRETEAHMETVIQNEYAESTWREMIPLLDEALARLGQVERDAVVLRYFENRTLQEVATALGVQERAVQKRVMRGLEKLRAFFLKRGVAISTATIAGVVSAKSVQAAPEGLKLSVVAAAKNSTMTSPTFVLAKGALKTMAWVKMKILLSAGAGLAILLAGIFLTLNATAFFGAGKMDQSPAWLLSDGVLPVDNGKAPGYHGHGELIRILNPGKLEVVQIPVQSVNTGRLNFFIAEDNNGLPGNVLETFSNILAPKVGDTNALHLQSIIHPELRVGAKYWICAETAGAGGGSVWFYSIDMPPKGFAEEQSASAWAWIGPVGTTSNALASRFVNYPNNIRKDAAYFTWLVVKP